MTKAKTNISEVPINPDGSVSFYTRYGGSTIPNYEFDDVLEYVGRHSTTYSKHFEWRRRSDGTSVYMNMFEFDECMPLVEKGTIEGRFTFVRRGSHISVRRLGYPSVPAPAIMGPWTGGVTPMPASPAAEAAKLLLGITEEKEEENGTLEA